MNLGVKKEQNHIDTNCPQFFLSRTAPGATNYKLRVAWQCSPQLGQLLLPIKAQMHNLFLYTSFRSIIGGKIAKTKIF